MKFTRTDFLKHELNLSPAFPTHRFMVRHLGKMVTVPSEANGGESSIL